jgi:CMP-N,N'-diacetyllegionaminic acid synthase
MKSVALIPARGGSKGFPRKNLAFFLGEPLIIHTIRYALASKIFSRVIVTTDDLEIAKISVEHGAEVPKLRPSELATDDASMIEVIKYCINEYNLSVYNSLVLLDPTSPIRNSIDLKHVVEEVESNPVIDGIVSISQPYYNPLWLGVEKGVGGLIKPMFKNESRRYGRQDFDEFWRINGLIYCWKMTKAITISNSYLADFKMSYIETPEIDSVAIDYKVQLTMLESLIASGAIKI